MSGKGRSIIVAGLVLHIFPVSGLSASASVWFEKLALPTQSSVRWAGLDVIQNGMRMDILAFESRHPVASVIDHFRLLWGGEADVTVPGFVESELGDWQIISSMRDGVSIVVQVLDRSDAILDRGTNQRTSGFISAMNVTGQLPPEIDHATHQLPDNLSLPPGSDIKSRTDSSELQKKSVTLVVTNTLSPSRNANFFREELQRTGWTINLLSKHQGVTTLGFIKQGHYCGITITNAGEGQSVMLLVRVIHE